MSEQDLRITTDELKSRMAAGEQFTVVDARNPLAWAESADKARGAIRVNAHSENLPPLPHDKPIVAYCT